VEKDDDVPSAPVAKPAEEEPALDKTMDLPPK
jgi:hypothetical protein